MGREDVINMGRGEKDGKRRKGGSESEVGSRRCGRKRGGGNAGRAKKGISSTLSPVNVCAHV
jgi:hypothetical protein